MIAVFANKNQMLLTIREQMLLAISEHLLQRVWIFVKLSLRFFWLGPLILFLQSLRLCLLLRLDNMGDLLEDSSKMLRFLPAIVSIL